jgi:hypothetical protein
MNIISANCWREVQRISLSVAVAALALCGTTIAEVVEPGQTIKLGGITAEKQPELAGTSVRDTKIPFTVRSVTGAPILTGVFQDGVRRSTKTGKMIFSHRLVELNAVARLTTVVAVRTENYGDVRVDTNYRTDGLGDVGPGSVTRSRSPGNSLQFDYSPNGITPPQETLFVDTLTDADAFALTGQVTIIVRNSNGGEFSVTIQETAAPAVTTQERTWIVIDESKPEGSPVMMEVTQAGQESTSLDVTIPGLWSEKLTVGERTFTRLLLPAVQLMGVGFPAKEGDLGWWDFPADLKMLKRNPQPFVSGCDGSVRPAVFPSSAVGSFPTTEKEMIRLGVYPEGARPGIPRLRGCVAVSRSTTARELDVSVEKGKPILRRFEFPIAPAGMEGSDAELYEGYDAPFLIDEEFYRSFEGRYEGTEPLLGEVSGMGTMAGVTFAIPAITVVGPGTVEINPNLKIFLKHLKGTEDFDCPIPWDSWIFDFPFINGNALRTLPHSLPQRLAR